MVTKLIADNSSPIGTNASGTMVVAIPEYEKGMSLCWYVHCPIMIEEPSKLDSNGDTSYSLICLMLASGDLFSFVLIEVACS